MSQPTQNPRVLTSDKKLELKRKTNIHCCCWIQDGKCIRMNTNNIDGVIIVRVAEF